LEKAARPIVAGRFAESGGVSTNILLRSVNLSVSVDVLYAGVQLGD